MDSNMMMKEAEGLGEAAQQLTKPILGKGMDLSQIPPLGFLLSSIILQALAAELALKSTHSILFGRYPKTHDLLQLFQGLNPDAIDKIEDLYRTMSRVVNAGKPTPVVVGDVQDVLRKHKSSFETWRYFHEFSNLGGADLSSLYVATLAILEFNAGLPSSSSPS